MLFTSLLFPMPYFSQIHNTSQLFLMYIYIYRRSTYFCWVQISLFLNPIKFGGHLISSYCNLFVINNTWVKKFIQPMKITKLSPQRIFLLLQCTHIFKPFYQTEDLELCLLSNHTEIWQMRLRNFFTCQWNELINIHWTEVLSKL